MITSWIMIDFASELPATYYGLYVLGLGETETILRAIGLAQFLALASMQFPGGYLYEHVAPQAPFMLAAIMTLPSFAAVLLLVKETQDKRSINNGLTTNHMWDAT